MKRVRSIFNFVLLTLFMFLIIPSTRAEAKSYEIMNYDVEVEVLPNGDTVFTESVKYNFSGDFNGVIRKIDLDGTTGLENLKVEVINNRGNTKVVNQHSFGNNSSSYYELKGLNIKEIKVYEKSISEIKTFRYTYTLKGLGERYKDISQLNRKIVDSYWDVPLNLINITIKIPEGAKKEDLKIFGHGDLLGEVEIVDNRTFKATVPLVNPGEVVEILAVMPENLLKDVTNIIDENRLPEIMANEKNLADISNNERDRLKSEIEKAKEKNRKEEEKKSLYERIKYFFVGIGGIGVLGSIIVAFKFGKNTPPTFKGDYYRELPGDYTPAVASSFVNQTNLTSKDLMATILDLARKGAMEIIPYRTTKNRGFFRGEVEEEDYILKGTMQNVREELSEHEIFLYRWFIEELGNNGELRLDDLENTIKSKSQGIKFANKFEVFQDKVKAKTQEQNFWKSRNLKGIGIFVLVAFALIGLGIFGVVYFEQYLPVAMIVGGVLLLVSCIILAAIPDLTQYGADQRAKWRAFKNFLLHFSNLDKSEIPSLKIWNHYLVYATALGIAKEVIEQLPKVFPQEELEAMQMSTAGGYYPIFYGHSFNRMDNVLSRSMETSMSAVRAEQIANSARSSSSGSGGGFSGGSSGGSGGGGGGGAF